MAKKAGPARYGGVSTKMAEWIWIVGSDERVDKGRRSSFGRSTVATHSESHRTGAQNESRPSDRARIKTPIGRARFILSARPVRLRMSRVRRMDPDGTNGGDVREVGLDGGDLSRYIWYIYIYKTTFNSIFIWFFNLFFDYFNFYFNFLI